MSTSHSVTFAISELRSLEQARLSDEAREARALLAARAAADAARAQAEQDERAKLEFIAHRQRLRDAHALGERSRDVRERPTHKAGATDAGAVGDRDIHDEREPAHSARVVAQHSTLGSSDRGAESSTAHSAEIAHLRRTVALLEQRMNAQPHREPSRSPGLVTAGLALAIACAAFGATLGTNRALDQQTPRVTAALDAVEHVVSTLQQMAARASETRLAPAANVPIAPNVMPPIRRPGARESANLPKAPPSAAAHLRRSAAPNVSDAIGDIDACGDNPLCGLELAPKR